MFQVASGKERITHATQKPQIGLMMVNFPRENVIVMSCHHLEKQESRCFSPATCYFNFMISSSCHVTRTLYFILINFVVRNIWSIGWWGETCARLKTKPNLVSFKRWHSITLVLKIEKFSTIIYNTCSFEKRIDWKNIRSAFKKWECIIHLKSWRKTLFRRNVIRKRKILTKSAKNWS